MAKEKARLIIESFNLMGYDAFGIGDDDLALGKEFLIELSKKANFPFLSSNLVEEGSGKHVFQPYLLREVNGLKIGIFSLISPDLFGEQDASRRKGLNVKDPVETAQSMVKDLKPKTDLIILLSHLGYPKDVEISKLAPGIHWIAGGHTGMNFVTPPIINSTVILQTGSKGMYAGRVDLTVHNRESSFYNGATRRSLESNLNHLVSQLKDPKAPEAERAQWTRAKQAIEANLKQLQGKNEFTNTIIGLGGNFNENPEIKKKVEEFRSKYPETGKP